MVYGSGGQSSDPEQLLADRYRQLLGYIAELDRLRSKTVLSVFANPDWLDLSERPAHPSISWKPEEPSAFLKVVRCVVPPSRHVRMRCVRGLSSIQVRVSRSQRDWGWRL